jgi:diguanylate cyclase (GGDEF)-like protein
MSNKSTSTINTDLKTLKHELRDRETELALLSETVNVVNSELDIQTVFQLVTQRAQSLINAETVLIPLLDADCLQYTYRAGYGKNTEEIVGESLPLDFGVCGWVWRHKRPWWRGVLDEIKAEERNKWEKEAGTIILVPLFGKRHILGGIAGINKIGGGEFTRRDLDLLTIFASQVSIAIENATYFEEINIAKQQAEAYQLELQALNADLERRVEERTAELAAANIKLQQMALHDPLTGLPNRTLIQDRLKYSIVHAKREGKHLSIMMLDLDRFKEINDNHGHHVGDLFLVEIATRLRAVLRESDTVGRLGGDEFAIILPGVPVVSAEKVATKIIKALEKPLMIEGNFLSPSGSLGIATYPDHGGDTTELLKYADAAMYVAKRTRAGL